MLTVKKRRAVRLPARPGLPQPQHIQDFPKDASREATSTTRVGPTKRLVNKTAKATASRKSAEATTKAEADRILQGVITRGVEAITPEVIATMKANPKLARAVNEEAAVQAAAAYGVNIRDARGKIDMKLARKAAEAAAIQSAAEMGFDITDKRGKINRRKALEAARAADAARAGKPVDARVSAWVNRQDAALADAVRAAEQRGFSVTQMRIEALKSDPELASQMAEQAAILAAAKAGIDIFKADGTIDMELARQVAQDEAIATAAEMGIDITDSSGNISRRKALEAARLADDARAGKPVSAQVAAAVSRHDARIIAALDAAQRQGKPPVVPGTNISRREACTDAELAALVRRTLQQTIR